MRDLWDFVVKNKEMLTWIGGGIAAIAGAVWTIIAHFLPARESKSKNGAGMSVMQSGTGIASGRDTVISGGEINIGLDATRVGEQVALAQKPLIEQFERLVAEVSRDKGVPVAPLRTILLKLGEAGFPEETIPQRLDAKADELLKLRGEIELLKQGPVELASLARRCQALIDEGDLEKARSVLAEGHARAQELREQSSRYEADFLAGEAEIDHLQLAYRSAAAKYLEAADLVARFDPEKRWRFLNNHAQELYNQGDGFGDNNALLQAIAAFRATLGEYTRERVPLQWATIQIYLGIALCTLGERESGTARLEDAVTAYRAALGEISRQRAPLQWASTQSNLGDTLTALGERESGAARLEEAVAALRAALEEITRRRAPLQWAMTQNNLGNALSWLGEREGSTARLEEAVAAYRAAMTERTRERVPLDWAMTQSNLGVALGKLGEREGSTARLEEAVTAFRAALGEITRERAPLQWAIIQNNLGNALRALGERESGTDRLEEAVTAYRAALGERTRERLPLDWAATQNNLEGRAEGARRARERHRPVGRSGRGVSGLLIGRRVFQRWDTRESRSR
jgi:tetratricopeptide (TPR) repeat protein